jgi:hypothetical protein
VGGARPGRRAAAGSGARQRRRRAAGVGCGDSAGAVAVAAAARQLARQLCAAQSLRCSSGRNRRRRGGGGGGGDSDGKKQPAFFHGQLSRADGPEGSAEARNLLFSVCEKLGQDVSSFSQWALLRQRIPKNPN